MFNFFRRSKKESNGSKGKKNKELCQERMRSPSLEMCKNNLTIQSNSVISLPNVTTSEFGLRENLANVASSEVTLAEKNDSDTTNSEKKTMTENVPSSSSPLPMIKKPDVLKESRHSSVKPCGHGTTAISPSVPITVGKRENISTPPGSPRTEWRRFSKIAPLERQNSNENSKVSVSTTPSANVEVLVESLEKGPSLVNGNDPEADKKNLISQEAKFQSQLNDLSKQLSIRDAEANKLRFQMEELQRDVFAKSAGMDRLEAELQAAHKECELLRQRIRLLENELIDFKERNHQLENSALDKTRSLSNFETETNEKIAELEGTIKDLQAKIVTLENELEKLKREKEKLEEQRVVLLGEREKEKTKIEEILKQATVQKQEIEQKWKKDFEQHRTINIMKEQQLLDDFEWKLREVQQTCKKRLEEKDKTIEMRLQEAYRDAELKMREAEQMMAQVETMKSYELEIEQLKGLTVDQQKAIQEMIDQQEQMKIAEESLKNEAKRLRNLIEIEKENLQHMQRKHNQEILDKERILKQTLRQKRTEIAMYWEERLLHECGRLKSELEQIHNDEKYFAMQTVRREKDEEFQKAQEVWDKKLKDSLNEITNLKRALIEKDAYYREEIIRSQTNTDRDILELRRLMDKIDMSHHERFEKLVQDHETELERINEENEQRIKEMENSCQNQVISLTNNLESVKEQMEKESQQKIESLIEQHRTELDAQWANLLNQKSEAVQLVEHEYVTKYNMLEEQFFTQQKSHGAREIELLKAIDSLKNELSSKESALNDLQNNVDTLEGGIQVLNSEIAQQNDQLSKTRKEADQKIRGLQEIVIKQQELQDREREAFRSKLMDVQKQSQETIDHLQRKCQCLTKLFEEVRLRYERRESRQEDLNIISDLRQVIAEQEKDLACLNEEKRYFQMRLISLESQLDGDGSTEEEHFEDAEQPSQSINMQDSQSYQPPPYPNLSTPTSFSIPPTIPECDE